MSLQKERSWNLSRLVQVLEVAITVEQIRFQEKPRLEDDQWLQESEKGCSEKMSYDGK